jgi:hypothetical protein
MAARNNPLRRQNKKRALQQSLQLALNGDARARQRLLAMSKNKATASRIARGINKPMSRSKKRTLLGAAKEPIYTVGGMAVTSIVSGGGGPGTGKRR